MASLVSVMEGGSRQMETSEVPLLAKCWRLSESGGGVLQSAVS